MSLDSRRVREEYLRPKQAALYLVLIVVLAGCALAAPAPEPVALTFYCSAEAGGMEYYQELIQAFNASHPHITVELDTADGDNADVFRSSQFAMYGLRREDAILSLDPFIAQDSSLDRPDFYPGTVELFTSEGEVWAIPAGMDIMVMFYNQDLFDAYQIPYPTVGWTWEEFLNAVIAISDPQAYVFGYLPLDELFDPLLFVYQHGGGIFDDEQNPTRTTFDDPLTVEAVAWYADLFQRYHVAPTEEQIREPGFGGTRQSGVYRNKVGMWAGWLGERGGGGGVEADWPAEWEMRWGMAPLPRDAQAATFAIVSGYYISSQTEHPEACWDLVAYLSHQAPRDQAPARRSLAESAAYEQFVGSDVAIVVRASMENVMMFSPNLDEFDQAFEILSDALERIISGAATPEEALTEAQRRAEVEIAAMGAETGTE